MLILFPLLAFVALAFLMASYFPELGWRHNFLRASILWGTWLVFAIELLSLFKTVSQIGLTLMWLALIGGCIVWLIKRWRDGFIPRHPDFSWFKNPGYAIMMLALVVIFVVVGIVAWFAPPNTYDSLNYHMPRVAHWAQNHSVAHYPTGVDRQDSFAPVAEYTMLNSYVLTGGDRFANFSDWFAMVGSVIGVSAAAALLGAPLAGQFLAALFVATLPMGIAQASSTMTDYVTGFWVVCVAVEFLFLWTEEKPNWRTVLFLSLSAGLALATKSTALTFLLPFAIATPVLLFRKTSRIQFLELVALAVLVVGLVNAGYVTRNLRTYGAPFDPRHSQDFPNQRLDWRGLVSTTLRTAVFQLQTPWDVLNLQLMRLVVGVHFKMGLDVNDPRSTVIGEFSIGKPTTNEDTTTNPLHALLILVTAAVSLFTVKRTGKRVLFYQLLVLAAFVAFSFMLKWQIFQSRLLLPFFLIAAPAFGVVLGSILPTWAATVVGLGLVASSFMWLVSINPRPLIPLSGKTEWPSVLTAPREQMYFTSIPGAYEPMKQVVSLIEGVQCKEVGMAISGAGAEYPYWVLLGAPRDDLRIEWIVAGTPSARYSDPGFKPCAVICDTCGDASSYRGLPLLTQFGKINLYENKK
jgi:hypothetical protein